jgi:hypothetical protein
LSLLETFQMMRQSRLLYLWGYEAFDEVNIS